MKKRLTVLLLIMTLVLSAASAAYALDVVSVTPKDGTSNSQPANMAVKITFSDTMIGNPNIDANAGKFKITDAEGNSAAFKMVYSEKYPNQLWLLLTDTLETNSEYTVSIGPGITSANGSETSGTVTTSFKTRNTSRDNMISTVLMIFMMGLMIFMSVVGSKKKEQEDRVLTVAQAEKLNPYKIAKSKKWTIEQANAYVEKEKEKARKAEAKAEENRRKKEALTAAEMAEIESEIDAEERRNGWFRVKSKESGSYKAHGRELPGSIKRKFNARRKAAEERAKRYAKNKKKKK